MQQDKLTLCCISRQARNSVCLRPVSCTATQVDAISTRICRYLIRWAILMRCLHPRIRVMWVQIGQSCLCCCLLTIQPVEARTNATIRFFHSLIDDRPYYKRKKTWIIYFFSPLHVRFIKCEYLITYTS